MKSLEVLLLWRCLWCRFVCGPHSSSFYTALTLMIVYLFIYLEPASDAAPEHCECSSKSVRCFSLLKISIHHLVGFGDCTAKLGTDAQGEGSLHCRLGRCYSHIFKAMKPLLFFPQAHKATVATKRRATVDVCLSPLLIVVGFDRCPQKHCSICAPF